MFRTKTLIPASILGAVAALSIAVAPANAATGKQPQRAAATKVHHKAADHKATGTKAVAHTKAAKRK